MDESWKGILLFLSVVGLIVFGLYNLFRYDYYVRTRQKQHDQYIIDCGILFELNETECAWLWSQAQDRR